MDNILQDKNFIEFYKEIRGYLASSSLNAKCNRTILCFAGSSRGWKIVDDETAEATAQIVTSSYRITFNPLLIAIQLYELRKPLKLEGDYNTYKWERNAMFICEYIKTFLLLHEVGHWLYTIEAKEAVKLARQYCSGYPVQLAMFLLNVVEDSVIQRLFLLEYRGSFYRKCFDIGICIFQGAEAVKTYVSHSEAQNWSIKTKLFYFIIRAYNLHNSEVQAMFNIPDKIGWKQDTLNAFDQAIVTIDKEDRCRYCFEILAPLVFRDLTEEIDTSGMSSVGSMQDLLDQDKLYTSKDQPEEQQSEGVSSSQSTSSKQQGSSSSKNSSSNEEEEDSTDEENSTQQGSSGEELEESEESNDNDNSGDSSGDEESDEDSSKGSSGSGSSSNEEEDSDSENSNGNKDNDDEDTSEEPKNNNTNNSSNNKESADPGTVEEKEPEQPMSLEEQIIEACNELNKSINASEEPEEMTEAPSLKPQGNPLALSCGVKDHTAETSRGVGTASMNDLTLDIYGNALNVLDKIFTMSDSTLRGLDQGELDEDELYTYFTEKNLNIYKEDIKLKQDKKVVCYFILDNSGSMSGSRYNYSSAAFIGLIHALEDIQIKCCFLSFGEQVRLIKKFEDPTSFLGTNSPLQYMVDNYVSDLESDTNLYPALDFVANDKTFLSQDPDLCKVVIVATDGATNNEAECSYLASKISSEALMFAVGLDMIGQESYLSRVMPGAQVHIYSGKDIASKLPEDIYEEIINKFLLF